jgi:IMP dehydrogenase
MSGWSTRAKAPALRKPRALLHKHRLERVLVVNDAFELRGLITVKDIQQVQRAPQRLQGRSRASCALALRWAWARAPKSASRRWWPPGVDVIVVDTAHGHAQGVLDRVRWVEAQPAPQVEVIGGNIATAAAAKALVDAWRRCA